MPSLARLTTALSKMMTIWHEGMIYYRPFLLQMMSQSTEVKEDARFMELMSSAMVSHVLLMVTVTAVVVVTSYRSL